MTKGTGIRRGMGRFRPQLVLGLWKHQIIWVWKTILIIEWRLLGMPNLLEQARRNHHKSIRNRRNIDYLGYNSFQWEEIIQQ